ncbi:hypothetical protein BD311DRAFT_804467 [Dichomitus squalens]|uniref:Uncharacterized protein n=1 Tax=Dichomitus squalens TaxID=114155 RepID=A0A4Q9MVB5_9APHY|nr:hypothetical protein BD311DRAFT_804467 [Dichomitus squalens]
MSDSLACAHAPWAIFLFLKRPMAIFNEARLDSPLPRALISPRDAAPSVACQRTLALSVHATRHEARAASFLHLDVIAPRGSDGGPRSVDHTPSVPSSDVGALTCSDVPKGCFGGLVAPDQSIIMALSASETLPYALASAGQQALSRARKMTKPGRTGVSFLSGP